MRSSLHDAAYAGIFSHGRLLAKVRGGIIRLSCSSSNKDGVYQKYRIELVLAFSLPSRHGLGS